MLDKLKKILGFFLLTPEVLVQIVNYLINRGGAIVENESHIKLKVKDVKFYDSCLKAGKVVVPYKSIKGAVKVSNIFLATVIVINSEERAHRYWVSKMSVKEREAVEEMLTTIVKINEYSDKNI